ncbi:DUF2254 domain-containing protein [Microbaculum marinum]|uniref:DUF2254 domain-containing protein n=1 Tax=Microbaculum marinum TaxID=1764581 RepID=A0AAW9RRB3_9HYPH
MPSSSTSLTGFLLRPWTRLVRSFVAVPAAFAVLAFVLGIVALRIDFGQYGVLERYGSILPPINPDTARTLLSVIAGSMMTVLSLVYSLTLIVFTLAAGNIGPRLIERFTSDRTTQITAGMLVGTFVYAVIVLSRIDVDDVPRVATFGALLLTGATLTSLIIFIRSVAERVSIDNEIGRVSSQLLAALESIATHEATEHTPIEELRGSGEKTSVKSASDGYVTALDAQSICAAAKDVDAFVEMNVRHGDFVIAGQEIAVVTGPEDIGGLAEAIRTAVFLERHRTADSDAEFSVHLLVEIAMRALSPGVNDSYTAIACIDQLSAALALPVSGFAPPPLSKDSDGKARLWFDGVSVNSLVGTALHPLRRAAAGNVTVTLRLIRSIGRLIAIAQSSHVPLLEKHLDLIVEDARREVSNDDDRDEIESLAIAARKRQGDTDTDSDGQDASGSS